MAYISTNGLKDKFNEFFEEIGNIELSCMYAIIILLKINQNSAYPCDNTARVQICENNFN